MALAVAKRHVRGRSLWPAGVSHVPAYIAGSLSQATPEIGIGDPGSEYDWLLFGYADRLYPWADYCGIPGGIPARETVYASFTSSATASQINSAIQACPSGQVVSLGAGTFSSLGGNINFGQSKSGVTLRGAGAGITIISGRSIGNVYATFSEASGIGVASGYSRGSMSITLSSAPSSNFVVGNIIIITEASSPNKWGAGIGTYNRAGNTSSVYLIDATRVMRFTTRITGVSGNTISLATPIPLDFSASLNVRAYVPGGTTVTSLCGIENLTMDGNSAVDKTFNFMCADRCWLKNVEVKNYYGSTGTVFFQASSQCEINRCYIHDAVGYPTQSDGFGVMLYYGTGGSLVIDNIFDNTGCSILMEGANCNALAYNYIGGVGGGNGTWQVSGINCNHGPHGIMNLFEGNSFNRFQNDSYHGSTSHGTLFRNNIHGVDPDGKTQERQLVDLCKGSYYHNVVGNVLGAASWNPDSYAAVLTAAHTLGYVYVLGWGEPDSADGTSCGSPFTGWSGTYPDANVAATLLRHGNYDYYNDATVWDGGISARDIPSSLFYDSKPSFFGSLAWPAIGPDLGTMVNDIPAKARWDRYVISGTLSDLFADEA